MKEKHSRRASDRHLLRRPLLLLLLLLGGLVFMASLIGASLGESEKTPSPTTNTNISAMFVMGDSSVDCGDNTLFYSRLHRNLSLLPCNGSHETLIPHRLAEKMALPYAVPFYTQNGSIETLTKGLNFGSAQATIMSPGSQGYQSLNQQLRQVSDTVQLLHLRLNQKNLLHFVRSSVFYLSFGKDDFVNLLLFSGAGNSSGGFGRILAEEMERAVRSLHDMRVRRIVCAGIVPIGCSPRARMASGAKGSCWEEMNEMVLEYNVAMEEKIMELNADFPDARIVFCDVYQGIRKILDDPRRYGFEDAKSACCGMGTYGAEIGCVSAEMACDDAESRVWWDQYNPTGAVNSLLAESAWSGEPFSGLCRPITIQQLASSSPPRVGSP